LLPAGGWQHVFPEGKVLPKLEDAEHCRHQAPQSAATSRNHSS
jgi:hypothetical protein